MDALLAVTFNNFSLDDTRREGRHKEVQAWHGLILDILKGLTFYYAERIILAAIFQ